MEWLTEEYIEKQAAISDEAALNVSIEHWEQICEAVRAGKDIRGHYFDDECGLCIRQCSDCKQCPLGPYACCNEWQAFKINHTLPNAEAMFNRLHLERSKRYGGKKEKPKKECKAEPIRHGDYGICEKYGTLHFFVYDASSALPDFYLINLEKLTYRGFENKVDKIICIAGNIDDLKLLGEDLEEFKVSGQYDHQDSKTLNSHYNARNNEIWMQIESSSSYFTINQATEIHQKLGQLIATAKRRKKDC